MKEIKKIETRIEELYEWIINNSSLNPQWDETVRKYQALKIKLTTLKKEKAIWAEIINN